MIVAVQVTGINVIGVLKGRNFNTPRDNVVGIGAHYDTMRNTPGTSHAVVHSRYVTHCGTLQVRHTLWYTLGTSHTEVHSRYVTH